MVTQRTDDTDPGVCPPLPRTWTPAGAESREVGRGPAPTFTMATSGRGVKARVRGGAGPPRCDAPEFRAEARRERTARRGAPALRAQSWAIRHPGAVNCRVHAEARRRGEKTALGVEAHDAAHHPSPSTTPKAPWGRHRSLSGAVVSLHGPLRASAPPREMQFSSLEALMPAGHSGARVRNANAEVADSGCLDSASGATILPNSRSARRWMRASNLLILLPMLISPVRARAQDPAPLRLGVVGLTHSHVHGLLGRKNRGDVVDRRHRRAEPRARAPLRRAVRPEHGSRVRLHDRDAREDAARRRRGVRQHLRASRRGAGRRAARHPRDGGEAARREPRPRAEDEGARGPASRRADGELRDDVVSDAVSRRRDRARRQHRPAAQGRRARRTPRAGEDQRRRPGVPRVAQGSRCGTAPAR